MTEANPVSSACLPERPPESAAEISLYLGAFTNYELLRKLPRSRRDLGPHRARQLLELLGLPPSGLPVIQVAGSKGKGSTVLWMEALLLARGARPGSYLSPHLEHRNERIRIAGQPVSDALVLQGLSELHPVLKQLQRQNPDLMPTFFDLWTVLALWTFARQGASHALLEVGLGGPLDSTSAIPHDVGILTSIDLEHQEELGATLLEIAREKARIARPGRPFIINDLRTCHGEAAAKAARSAGARVSGVPTKLRLPEQVAPPQDQNLATAVTALEALYTNRPIPTPEIDKAVASIQLPGRLEELPGPPPLLLDSAHTRLAMEYFRKHFRAWRGSRRGALLVGFLNGKNWQDALQGFAAEARELHWIVTCPDPRRGLDPTKIAGFLAPWQADVVTVLEPQRALEKLLERATRATPVAVTGSFYLAGRARSFWRALRK
ncbi:MAG: hypothetical protein V3T77_01390 [Planctomycetota bacterium]